MDNPFECWFERVHGQHAWRIEFYRHGPNRTIERAAGFGPTGDIEFETIDEGAAVGRPFLILDHGVFMALRDALVTEYDPPTESKALREALALERQRVDSILERALRA